jgi:hypothetical protein
MLFIPYGEVKKVKILLKNYCAFVTFNDRNSAENAMNNLYNKFMIKGEKFKLQWGRSAKTNFEEEEHENKNNLKDITYKTECPINDPLNNNNIFTKVNDRNFNLKNEKNINNNLNNIKNNNTFYNVNLFNFEKGKKPYYPSMDPNLMGGEIKSRKNLKKDFNENKKGNESQKNFEKIMQLYNDADE